MGALLSFIYIFLFLKLRELKFRNPFKFDVLYYPQYHLLIN